MRSTFMARFTADATRTAVSASTSTSAVALSAKSPVVWFFADGAKIYVRLGTSAVGDASASAYTFFIPADNAIPVEIPEQFTHYKAFSTSACSISHNIGG